MWYLGGRNFGRLVKNTTIEEFTALMWYLGGNNFACLVKNTTIEKFTAQMWYLASSNFGRLVRNRTIEKFTALMWYLGADTSETFEKTNHVYEGQDHREFCSSDVVSWSRYFGNV